MDISEIKKIEDDVYTILTTVMDPEIEIDIINLGLVYDIKYDGENIVNVLMTLSTPSCPLSDAIVQNIEGSIKNEYPNFTINVEITFEPRWNTDMISEEGKNILGM
ncbi:MAG TPA: FeS assembly SUF system protein [Flavobacteriaceae bacterium]|nr:FeS assembly SUF system protein [Flavobacteriaceae bacterium]